MRLRFEVLIDTPDDFGEALRWFKNNENLAVTQHLKDIAVDSVDIYMRKVMDMYKFHKDHQPTSEG